MDGAGTEAQRNDAWDNGTRRVGGVLEVRDRWQGLVGPNAWLTVALAMGTVAFALPALSGDHVATGFAMLAAACAAGLVLVVVCLYPFVAFGPDHIEWRNRFRRKAVPTASVKQLRIVNNNSRAWVPVVAADLDRKLARRRSARFVATFSYRRSVAERIATELRTWADENDIPADLKVEQMTWAPLNSTRREASRP